MKCPSTLAYSSDLPMPYPALAMPHANLSMPYLSLVMPHPSLRYVTLPSLRYVTPYLNFAVPPVGSCMVVNTVQKLLGTYD
jgi:hypothetical protein